MKTKTIVTTAILTALGIVIPLLMPKLPVDQMYGSYTLASHVPIMISMFLSPIAALFVGLGTALGFVFTGMPFVIAVRALTHLIWAVPFAFILKKKPQMAKNIVFLIISAVVIALVHSAAETLVVYLMSTAKPVLAFYALGFVLHSLVDFGIAVAITFPLRKAKLL